MTESDYQQHWQDRGFSFGIGTIKFDGGVAEAVHDDLDELVVAVNGVLEFTIDGDTFIAECDSEVFIPATSVHSIKNIGSEVSTIYYGYKQTGK